MRPVAGSVVGAVLMLLILVPAASFTSDRPARWGWQMYSANVEGTKINVELGDGAVLEFSLGNVAASVRADVDYDRAAVARFVCEQKPDAVRVTVINSNRESFPCADF